jgi:hypothetical protein
MFASLWPLALPLFTAQSDLEIDPLVLCLRLSAHCFVDDAFKTAIAVLEDFESDPRALDVLIQIARENCTVFKLGWPVLVDFLSQADKRGGLSDAPDIFGESERFDCESLTDFAYAVCQRALRDLDEIPPRAFLSEQLAAIVHYNQQRPYFIWTGLWSVIGPFLYRVATSSRTDVAAIGINLLRSLSAKFLGNRELIEFHFQRNFAKTLFDAFQGQRAAESRVYFLQSLSGIIMESGELLDTGWRFVLQILAVAAREAATRPLAFEILAAVIRTRLTSVSDLLPMIIDLLATFGRKGSRGDSGLFAALAGSLPADSELWRALARAADDADALANVLVCAAEKHCDAELIYGIFECELPRLEAARGPFFRRLFGNLSPLLRESKGVLIRLLRFGFTIDSFAEGAVAALTDFASALDVDDIASLLKDVGPAVPKLSAATTVALSDVAQMAGVAGRRFLEDLAQAVEQEGDADRKAVIAAGVRLALLKCIEQESSTSVDDLAECVRNTLEMFIESGTAADGDSVAGDAWASTVAEMVRRLNGYEQMQFAKCFAAGRELFVRIIVSASKEVRAEIGKAIQKGMAADAQV